jgi:hypothetical protein
MQRVYPFTNENLSSYQNLYNFDDAKVLSVLGSGDQYFSSLLHGAKEIELYDCNFLTWDFFVLKYYGILILNYEEFYDFFVTQKLDDLRCFKKLLPYLPADVASRLEKLQNQYKLLSRLLYLDVIKEKYDNGHAIPYFDKEKYYKLQAILRTQKLPTFYLSYLQSMPSIVENKSYDIILNSNIFDWLYADLKDECIEECIKEYKDLLNKFNYGEIQAIYCWNISEFQKQKLEKYEFQIESVPGIKTLSLSKDSVVSLRNK